MSNTVKEYFGSKGWLTRYARAEDSRGMWQKYVDEVESNKVHEPRTMELAELPRSEWDNMNTPDLEQTPDSVLQPGQTLEDDFDVSFRKANAEGGVQQLVQNTDDGSRPGYKGPGQPKNYNLEQVTNAINNANSKIEFTTLKDLAKGLDGVSSASHLEGIIKRQSLPKLDSHAIKAEKAFIELFKDSTRNADEVIKPLHKIVEMMGMYGGKERVRIDSITNALKKSKVLNYAEDVKPLINKLSSANFIESIKGKDWNITDVEHSIYNKTMLKAPKTDAENLMNYVIRHQNQAGKDAVFNIFDEKSGKRITDMTQVDSYHDIIFKDSKGKVYDIDYMTRKGRTDPMFKEYFDIQEKLKDMQGKKHWPDGSKIIDHTGKHVTFGNYSGSMYTHGYGYKKPYARFPYETDHLNLKKHPFKNLTILPQRINVAIGAADRLKKPDIKYKIGGEHFRNLSIDDLMMQEKALGEKILIFDAEGNHIGKKLKTPYSAAKIKAIKTKFNVPASKSGTELFSFPANLKNLKKVRGKGTLIGGAIELAFYKLDVMNEMAKGKSEDEAKAQALENATLGLYKNKRYLENLKKFAEDQGIDSRAFDKVYALNDMVGKIDSQKNYYKEKIEAAKKIKTTNQEEVNKKNEVIKGLEKASASFNKSSQGMIERNIEKVAGQVSISKAGEMFPTPNLDQIADARSNITQKDFLKPFTNLRNTAFDKLKKEKEAAFKTQSKQFDTEAGNIGNWLNTRIMTLDAPGRTKEQEYINEMAKNYPQELYRYNLARGVDPDNPVTGEAYQILKAKHSGLGLATGGLAGLMKKYYD